MVLLFCVGSCHTDNEQSAGSWFLCCLGLCHWGNYCSDKSLPPLSVHRSVYTKGRFQETPWDVTVIEVLLYQHNKYLQWDSSQHNREGTCNMLKIIFRVCIQTVAIETLLMWLYVNNVWWVWADSDSWAPKCIHRKHLNRDHIKKSWCHSCINPGHHYNSYYSSRWNKQRRN